MVIRIIEWFSDQCGESFALASIPSGIGSHVLLSSRNPENKNIRLLSRHLGTRLLYNLSVNTLALVQVSLPVMFVTANIQQGEEII